jgi:RimJ/RimL family protein N-acetyltransferase
VTTIIETARLRLRTVALDDAAFYLGLVNDPAFIANIGDRGIRTLEAAREALTSGPMLMYAARGHSLYIVERRDDGESIGMCGLIKRDTLADVDIGYAMLPAWRGQGYCGEAAAAVLAHARDTLGMHRLVAICSPGNAASNALLQKIGLQFERLVHLTPEDSGTNLYVCDWAT